MEEFRIFLIHKTCAVGDNGASEWSQSEHNPIWQHARMYYAHIKHIILAKINLWSCAKCGHE